MKKTNRARDEATEPLAAYRDRELAAMHRVLFDPAAPHHALRRAFLRKEFPPGAGPALRE
ncbi:hypothetical protein AN220_30600 [Streptomyces nanshensis]|nr:hypothetical protein AN220_30600 [Streptomyces nanshensis]